MKFYWIPIISVTENFN